jgi:hypothetical protein
MSDLPFRRLKTRRPIAIYVQPAVR